jgi:protocatechuate 3,4-dioxygenase beta subunit
MTVGRRSDVPLEPYAEETQPTRVIAGYVKTEHRTPLHAPWPRIVATADVTGPDLTSAHEAASTCDLSRITPHRPVAQGQRIVITGRVLDQDGAPVRRALLEVWQANAGGRYEHSRDPSPVPVDPNFVGVGRIITDARGGYTLYSIKPGAYAVPEERGGAANWWRPPHIHFSLFGSCFASRLITQVYFPGEPLNERDLLLNSIPDVAARGRLICRPRETSETWDALAFTHDFVLRGRNETPFEDR